MGPARNFRTTGAHGTPAARTPGPATPLTNGHALMSTTDYIVDILLIVVIFRQLRPLEVSLRTAILPIAVMIWAGFHYLHGFKVAGNDVLLMAVLTVSGIALGTLSGITTQVWDGGGQVLARVGAAAIIFWVLGMGFRFAF